MPRGLVVGSSVDMFGGIWGWIGSQVRRYFRIVSIAMLTWSCGNGSEFVCSRVDFGCEFGGLSVLGVSCQEYSSKPIVGFLCCRENCVTGDRSVVRNCTVYTLCQPSSPTHCTTMMELRTPPTRLQIQISGYPSSIIIPKTSRGLKTEDPSQWSRRIAFPDLHATASAPTFLLVSYVSDSIRSIPRIRLLEIGMALHWRCTRQGRPRDRVEGGLSSVSPSLSVGLSLTHSVSEAQLEPGPIRGF